MNGKLLIHLDYCLTPTTRLNNAAIVIEDGMIQSVGGFSAFVNLEDYDIIEMPGCYAVPGFLDSRLYGAAEFDCMHADKSEKINEMSIALATHGVTSFLPTTQSCPHEQLLSVVEALSYRVDDEKLPGAVPCGIHIEGPYLSEEKRGAHPAEYLQPIDIAKAKEIIAAGKGKIRILTFAPELDLSLELIELLGEHEIVPCMGHTMAGQASIMRAIDAGAIRCSHLYNGMGALEQRKVGLAAIAMTDDRIWVELIPDGVHFHWGMLELACRSIRKDRIIAVSNSTEAAGLADGDYHLGDRNITVRYGKATLDDGTIAGSTNFLAQNYRNLMEHSNLSHEEAAAAFSLNPAISIGARNRGKIKPGKRADITIMDDNNRVKMTLVEGRIVYQHENYLAEQAN